MPFFIAMTKPIKTRNRKTRGAGFSLVELLVVIFIIAVTTGIFLFSYGEDRVAKELEASSQEFLSVLREAQNYALTGKQLEGDTIPCGYKVDWSNSNTSYRLLYYYRTTNEPACQIPLDSNASSLVYTRELKGAVLASPGDLFFTLPHGVPIPTPINGAPVSVTLVQGSAVRVVCLYAEGRLSHYEGNSCPF